MKNVIESYNLIDDNLLLRKSAYLCAENHVKRSNEKQNQ